MNILSCCLFAAFSVTVGELPPCDYADTECSTNFQVAVDFATMSRFEFSLALDASPNNAVEVAIGTDADGDGNLSVEETAYVFGYDCGTWFERTTETSTETRTPVGNATRLERTFILNRRKVRACWNMTKVTRRGFGTFGESATIRGRLPGFKLSIQ